MSAWLQHDHSVVQPKSKACVTAQELVSDVHCIIDAMIGKDSGVGLLCPCTEGVPDVVLVRIP